MVNAKGRRQGDKRKRVKARDASDVDGYLGPWAKFVDQKDIAAPNAEQQAIIDSYIAEREAKEGQAAKRERKDEDTESAKLHSRILRVEGGEDWAGKHR